MFAVGAASAWIASGYPLGTPTSLGPGALPLGLSLLLCVLGGAIILERDGSGFPVPRLHWRPVVMIFGALISFALILPAFGLIPATVVLVTLSTFAHHQPDLRMLIGNVIILSIVGAVIFVWLLGLSLDLFSWR